MGVYAIPICYFVDTVFFCQLSIHPGHGFCKSENGRHAETLFFYENNWKLYRDIALEKGYIRSYRLEKTRADSAGAFDLILITEYPDSSAYHKSEENFRDILATARPNGPVLLNELKPAEFRQNVFVKVTETLYQGNPRKKKKRSRND